MTAGGASQGASGPGRRRQQPLLGLLLGLLALAARSPFLEAAAEAGEDLVDGHYEGTTLTRLAFGSCNKQWRNNSLWEPIVAFQPQAYLWLGDAVYVKEREGDNEANLRKAYTRQLASPGYKRLLATGAVVEGVYDDHDMSTNDGHRVNYTPGRQAAYLDFLGHVAKDNPRRRRQGLYSAHVFGEGDKQVKVLFLDVRSLSDDPALLFPGSNNSKYWIPLKPYWLALTRWLAVVLGYTERYAGDVLGETQWAWLETQLAGSAAAAHVIVSSIQVLSTNPIVEGWQHYPRAQARLLALLNQHQPKGLVLLSGDVHFSELLTTDSEPREPFEVTSSGMTHTCFATAFGMCEMAVHRYNRHRLTPQAFYGGLNYGTIEFDWGAQPGPQLNVSVRDKKGRARLTMAKPVGQAAAWVPLGTPYRMQDNHDLAFFLLAQLFVMCVALALASIVMAFVRWRRQRRAAAAKAKANGGKANGSNGDGAAAPAAAPAAATRRAKARKAD